MPVTTRAATAPCLAMTLVSRTVQMLALLGVLSVVLFHVLHLMPGSAEDLLIASDPTIARADVARLRRLRGLGWL